MKQGVLSLTLDKVYKGIGKEPIKYPSVDTVRINMVDSAFIVEILLSDVTYNEIFFLDKSKKEFSALSLKDALIIGLKLSISDKIDYMSMPFCPNLVNVNKDMINFDKDNDIFYIIVDGNTGLIKNVLKDTMNKNVFKFLGDKVKKAEYYTEENEQLKQMDSMVESIFNRFSNKEIYDLGIKFI